ncbi:hypothetical protein K501DRAFT_266627 [Backusella circina FSU 941]|nr:hypothetical protein K501DRAFT_266627 [Backusella circina FSU 941]
MKNYISHGKRKSSLISKFGFGRILVAILIPLSFIQLLLYRLQKKLTNQVFLFPNLPEKSDKRLLWEIAQLKSRVNGLNVEKKMLKEKQEKLEYCGRVQRECRMRANTENMEFGTHVRELSAKLEKQKNSDLKNEMCLLLESNVNELVNATAAADIAMAELVKEEERKKTERSKTQNKPATPKERKKKKKNKAK